VILPSKSLFEQSDVIGAYWHGYLQLRQKVIDPPGEVKPETEIYWELGKRLGLSEGDLRGFLPEPGEASVEAWLQGRLDPLGIRLEQLREGPVLAPGTPEVAFADLRFSTPSGRIELWSDEAAQRWKVAALPDYREPIEGLGGGKFPLQLVTPNTKNSIHSQFLHLHVIQQFEPGPFLFIGPGDAEARGLQQGHFARVFNERGEVRLPVRIDFGLRPGVVVAFNGFGTEAGGSVYLLSLGRETDMGYGAAFHDNGVEVERVP
ncbi:MAG: molybdopterin dinucleotide binding domain-containing protein, partial [Holophaga sp.]|nr:molybdopterin dinucleotide binding domain-containing protein [Holophaga sp.]